MILRVRSLVIPLVLVMAPGIAWAADPAGQSLDLTSHPIGLLALLVFVGAYLLVMSEEFTELRKSKPVILGAGIIWSLVAYAYRGHPDAHAVEQQLRHSLLEYAELGLFILVAMTYINAMHERRVFRALRSWLINRRMGLRAMFWVTGWLAFFISPLADNLTTALLMGAVIVSVGGDNGRFITLACVNVVVAANAGGAFSPFGDITTPMVWQKGMVDFGNFFHLFLPSVVNFLVPALIMSFAVPRSGGESHAPVITLKRGGRRIIGLFVLTIATAVSMHNFLHLPPMLGMMTGLGYLGFFSYYLKRFPADSSDGMRDVSTGDYHPYDLFRMMEQAEWDTIFFFYGVVLCVGGLATVGYLNMASVAMYTDLGPTVANVLVGVLSAIVDNIPVMFAVLTMEPDMSLGQWLLVTLTAGVGGSLLSIGSAAGVALMGQARGCYTFFGHLKWTPVIALGYAASIYTHLWLNSAYF